MPPVAANPSFHLIALILPVLVWSGCTSHEGALPDPPPGEAEEHSDAVNQGLPEAYDGAMPIKRIQIVATEHAFEPEEIEAMPAQRLAITYVNRGTQMHRLEFELPDRVVEFGMVDAGVSTTQEFNAPAEPGMYIFHCPISKHRDLGMQGRLIVTQPTDPQDSSEE